MPQPEHTGVYMDLNGLGGVWLVMEWRNVYRAVCIVKRVTGHGVNSNVGVCGGGGEWVRD